MPVMTMNPHEFRGDEEFAYMYESPRHAIGQQWLQAIAHCEGGDVADIGCGPSGVYWAMGYVHRAKSISFYDKLSEYVSMTSELFSQLDPIFVETYYGKTVTYLREHHLLPDDQTIQSLSAQLVTKVGDISQHDLINDGPLPRQYDSLIAMEVLEIVDTVDQLRKSVKHVFESLRVGGQLIGTSVRYRQIDPGRLTHCYGMSLLGELNPTQEMLQAAFQGAGFTIEYLETIQRNQEAIYPEEIAFRLRKPKNG